MLLLLFCWWLKNVGQKTQETIIPVRCHFGGSEEGEDDRPELPSCQEAGPKIHSPSSGAFYEVIRVSKFNH